MSTEKPPKYDMVQRPINSFHFSLTARGEPEAGGHHPDESINAAFQRYGAPKIQRPAQLLAIGLVDEDHLVGCRARVAAECAVPIECEHGVDACPKCDPCTCAELRARAAAPYDGKPDRKRCRDCWTGDAHSNTEHAIAVAKAPR